MGKGSGIIRNITIFSGLSVAALHLFNRFESTRACIQNQERTREDKTYNWRSGNVDYKVKGYGDPILLIHDLNIGSNKAEFSFIFDILSADHKVYCPDLPGFGKSDKPAMTYTASMYEDMITEFIRDVIKTETDIVVTGSSAPIIIKLAHNNPKLVKKLIMINPLGLYDQNLIPSIQSRLLKVFINIPILGTFYYNMNSTKQALSDKFNNEYLGDIADTDSDKIEQIILQYYRSAHEGGIFAKHAYASHLAQYMTVNVLHELQEDKHPILLIGGEYEPDIEANIENYSFYKNELKSVIIAGSAHLPQIDNAEETAEHIVAFIKNNDHSEES